MSRNEDITTAIWVDLMDLAPDAKLLYIWSWTNEHNGMAGLYKIHEAMISVETGLDAERLQAAFAELAEHTFLFYVEGVIWVRTRCRRLRSRTPQIAKSVAKDLSVIRSEHPLLVRFLSAYGDESWLREALGPNLTRGSSEVHEKTRQQGKSVNLSGTSPEVPLSGTGVKSSGSEKIELPSEFPEALRPHLRAAWRVLNDLAVRHGAKAVNPLSLANVVMARQHKPLVRAAHDCAAHWDDGNRRVQRVVSAYSNWLDRTDDLAGFEYLTDTGAPVQPPRPNGVVSPLSRRQSPSDLLRALDGAA